jgi:8-oxo-dGTP pyrophosphatase MutT (NUDIX family)
MTEATLILPLRRRKGTLEVLFGIKTRKIGMGLRNAPGGKLEKTDKTIVHCAKRELRKEVGLIAKLSHLKKVGLIDFHNKGFEDFRVHIFILRKFKGKARPSDEMTDLRWFPWNKMPYQKMMRADPLWLRRVRLGKPFYCEVFYSKKNKRVLKIRFQTLRQPLLPLFFIAKLFTPPCMTVGLKNNCTHMSCNQCWNMSLL